MPLQLGDFKVPTVGDLFSGSEAIVGNVIEDVIQAVTGQTVELTPGQGVDRTKVKGPNGSGDVELDKKLASHEEVEKLKQELKKALLKLQGVVKISHTTINGTSLLNLDGFAPASQWEELSAGLPQQNLEAAS